MFVRIRIEYLFAILLAFMGVGSAWAPGEFALLGLGGFLLLVSLGLSLGERRRRTTAPPQ